ncbi:MLP-like protein 43 [Neltuma alba]|uniref:MLP-like protein 43 n=1 Tax=Neltuma alba TaxID=207710 RepID=UPI0010A41E3C|nr:MLP-like protein 43 [Prosopis alba]XP_028759034.1 MLP-like protein 43 [Prosopis alba]XP_028759035.1 MLP-like protein 43 [Prosopis alba]XP_028759036.1 MLP-like protein 43 [Prosopis alba]
MALTGKLEIENEIQTPASKFFHLFTKQLHHVQNITDHIHVGELHEGEDWHNIGSVKQWSYTVDGKVVKCKERIEVYDEVNNIIKFDLFEGDLMEQYKSFKITLQISDKGAGGGAVVKWIIDYEKLNEGIPDPSGYLDYVTNVTKDADAHLLTA